MVVIKIKEIVKKQTTNGSDMWTIKDQEGKTMATFDDDVAVTLDEAYSNNSDVEITVKVKGAYTNILTAKIVDNHAVRGITVEEAVKGFKEQALRELPDVPKFEGLDAKGKSIVAQVCVKGAVELAKERTAAPSRGFDNFDELEEYLQKATLTLAQAYTSAVDVL